MGSFGGLGLANCGVVANSWGVTTCPGAVPEAFVGLPVRDEGL